MKNVSLLIKSDKNDRFDYGMTKNTDINLSCRDYEVEYAIILLIQADSVLKYIKTNWKLKEDNIAKKSHLGNYYI